MNDELERSFQRLKPTAPTTHNEHVLFQITDIKVLDAVPESLGNALVTSGREFVDFVERASNDDGAAKVSHCTVLVFGIAENGSSVLVRVNDFCPSLMYEANGREGAEAFRHRLARALRVDVPSLIKVQARKMQNMYGWEPNSAFFPDGRKEHTYLQAYFPTRAMFKQAIFKSKVQGADKVHEVNISPEYKFMDEVNVTASQWALVSGEMCTPANKISHCVTEIICRQHRFKPYLSNHAVTNETEDAVREKASRIAPYLIANLDIECISPSGAFPEAQEATDIICMVGITYWRFGAPSEAAIRVMHVVGPCDPVDAMLLRCYDTEKEMLEGVRRELVLHADPDIIATYYGFGFDLKYLCDRAKLLQCHEFMYLDRLICQKATGRTKELTSAALGANDLFIIDMNGRSNLDIFHWIKAREKLQSYSLEDVCSHFLSEHKVPMKYSALYDLAQTPAGRAIIAHYCGQDCFLLVRLLVKLQIIPANTEMSRACFVSMEMLVTRGQQIKVIHQLIHYGHRMGARDRTFTGGYVMNTPFAFSGGKDDGYEGATVIEAKTKFYKEPIAVLDFMSLYPSIMLANNFCCSTLVQKKEFIGVPGVHYVSVEVTPQKTYLWAIGTLGRKWRRTTAPSLPEAVVHREEEVLDNEATPSLATRLSVVPTERGAVDCDEVFVLDVAYTAVVCLRAGDIVCSRDAQGNECYFECMVLQMPGVLQGTLQNLLKERKRAKQLKATARDADSKAVYEGRQLALKISANSIYGFTGAVKTGQYHCLAVADCVTFRAREMLQLSVELVQRFAPCDVVYGDTDSLMVKFENAPTNEGVFDLGDAAATWITAEFCRITQTKYIILEMEKVYKGYLLMNKKRYAGLLYTRKDTGAVTYDYLDAKGIQLIRRDNCSLAKMAQKSVLDELLHRTNPEGACAAVRAILEKVVCDEYDILQYKMSKSLRKGYKTNDLPHVHVASKMEARDKGSAPKVGDRVPYVLVQTRNPNAKAWEKAEDPNYALAHNIPVDRLYYVEHQIVNPVTCLLDFVEEIPDPMALFHPYIAELKRQQMGIRDIRQMLGGSGQAGPSAPSQSTAVAARASGPPAKKKAKKAPHGSGSIFSFLEKKCDMTNGAECPANLTPNVETLSDPLSNEPVERRNV